MKITVYSATHVSRMLAAKGVHANRGTVAKAAARAGVGVYVEPESEGRSTRCVGIAWEDIPAVEAAISKVVGNPNFYTSSNPQTLQKAARDRARREFDRKAAGAKKAKGAKK
jgi:hypothetical protein